MTHHATPPSGGDDADRPGAGLGVLDRVRLLARLDGAPRHRPPAVPLLVLATVVALAGSVLLDAAAVRAGRALFRTTAGFSHFRFSDYATLTTIGVLGACAAWPVITRLTSSARWLLLRLAVAVTLILWLPDVWILVQGENAKGVAVLMVMHLAIAVVTYNVLVRVAPARRAPDGESTEAAAPGAIGQRLDGRTVRLVWNTMAMLVAAELVFGVITIAVVPYHRSDTALPGRGAVIYEIHGGIGAVLGLGALAVLVIATMADRLARIGAVIGAAGVAVGMAGGAAAEFQATRLLGVGLMLVGVVAAGIGYLVPALEEFGRAERERAERERARLQAAGAPPAMRVPAPYLDSSGRTAVSVTEPAGTENVPDGHRGGESRGSGEPGRGQADTVAGDVKQAGGDVKDAAET